MSDDLRLRPGPTEPKRSLNAAQPRKSVRPPPIAASRNAILDELDRKASGSYRYADWPERVPGVPIGFLPGSAGPLCYELDTHRLVLGRSGGGKATAAISYMLLHDDGHAVVMVDPKDGTITRATAGYRQTLGPVHIIDPYNMTGVFGSVPCARFNPFDALDPQSPTLVEDAANLAAALCYLPNGGGDENNFWDRSARLFTHALILHLVTAPRETPTLLRLWALLTYPADQFLEEVVQPMSESPACDGTVARLGNALAQHALGNMRSFSDVMATIRSYLSWIEFQQVRAVSIGSTFDFGRVREQGGTVYIVMDDDRLEVCASWLRLLLQAARLGLKRSASRRPVHFIIDEAAALGKLDLITTALRAWRAAGIRLHLFYQSVSQIEAAFKDGWRAVANTDVLQFMGCNPGDTDTAEFISKIFGERDMIVPTSGDGTSATSGSSDSRAHGQSTTATHGTSSNQSTSVTLSEGSNWSTAIGISHTSSNSLTTSESHSTTSGSSTTSSQHGPQTTYSSSSSDSYSQSRSHSESETNSRTTTEGGNRSRANGATHGSGTNASEAVGQSNTITRGTSLSEGTSTSRSFTLQLRRTLRPEEVRTLPEEQLIVIAGNRAPALVHKEHFFRNPRLVARAMLPYDPALPGPVPRAVRQLQLTAPTLSLAGSLVSGLLRLFRPDKPAG